MTSFSNPLNNTLANKIKSIERRLNGLEQTSQPYLGDWKEIAEPVQYNSDNVIQFTNVEFDPEAVFAVGDKIRLKQGGAYKYFYVIKTTNQIVYLDAGDDYTVVSGSITDIAKGLNNAAGHPQYFTFTPSLDAQSMTESSTFTEGLYFMNGKTVFAQARWSSTFTGTASSNVGLETPLPISFNTLVEEIYPATRINVNGNLEIGVFVLNVSTDSVLFQRADFSSWSTAGTGLSQGGYNVSYIIDDS